MNNAIYYNKIKLHFVYSITNFNGFVHHINKKYNIICNSNVPCISFHSKTKSFHLKTKSF